MKTVPSADNSHAWTQNAEDRFRPMKIWLYAVTAVLGFGGPAAAAGDPKPTAVFPIGFDDTSLQGQEQGPRRDEQMRLAALDKQLHEGLAQSGCCVIAEAPEEAQGTGLPSCDGCEVDAARHVNAVIAVTGWVQKVSNLILNINIVARDVSTGKVIRAGSVDIRGDTDESWSRGLSYLLRNRLHPSEWSGSVPPGKD